MSWYHPVPEHPGHPAWRFRDPSSTRALATIVTLALVVALAAGFAPLVSSTVPTGVEQYLPRVGEVRVVAQRDDPQRRWQIQAGYLEGPVAHGQLTPVVSTDLSAGGLTPERTTARWLVVDAAQPDGEAVISSFHYEVADGDPGRPSVGLVAIENLSGWSTFVPALPTLDPRLVAGEERSWAGRITLAGATGEPTTADARAVVTARAEGPDGCLAVRAAITAPSGIDLVLVTSWCSGDTPGWAGLSDDAGSGYGPEPVAPPAPTLDLSPPDAPPLGAGRVDRVRLTRAVGNTLRLFDVLTESGTARSGDGFVVADINGIVTAFSPLQARDTGYSDYVLRWRARPGGAVRGLVSVGEMVVVGTSDRTVTGYDRAGWQRWRVRTDDAVIDVHDWGEVVAVTDAGGTTRVLDVATGQERWSVGIDGLVDRPVLGGTTDTDAVIAWRSGDRLVVSDLVTGRPLWSSVIGQRTVALSVARDEVVVREGNWLVARSARSGDERWTRSVPATALPRGSATTLAVLTADAVTQLRPGGTPGWQAPAGVAVWVGQDTTVLAYPRALLAVDDAGAVDRWDFADQVAPPQSTALTPTGRGLIALQRDPSGTGWWEYS